MVHSKVKLVLIGIGIVAYTATIYVISTHISMKYLSRKLVTELNTNQAMFEFDRILEGREFKELLSKGCVAEAMATVDMSIDMNTQLLADQFKEGLTPSGIKYISDRDPNFLHTLDDFKSKYGNIWTKKTCEK